MKKMRFLLLLALVLLCMGATAFAANIPGQQTIASISDASGNVTSLTDDDASTAWIKSADNGTDLTIALYGGSVGEIWIRSGYAYTQNWYNHYDRPDVVKVTVYYRANQYTASYDSYRYRLTDAYRPNTLSADWNSGYQRLLLPKKYTGVTKIELTIESTINGYGNAGTAIADIIVAGGSHITATPKAYATATPKPYVVYVTPTPGPVTDDDDQVTYITPIPEDDEPAEEEPPLVELLTPPVTPTPTPLVQLITPAATEVPVPEITREPINYPSDGGVIATLSKRVATRSGPSTGYDEPGSFFSAGDEIKVLTKVWDNRNNTWWYQIEFQYRDEWYRAYSTEGYVDVDPAIVADEPATPIESRKAVKKCQARFGPGEEYRLYSITVIHEGTGCDVYAIENGWVQIEYTDYGLEDYPRRRGWVPLDAIYGD